MNFALKVPTADGSSTLRHPVTGETYHSLRGALGESLHVFIGNGLRKVVGDRMTEGKPSKGAAENGLWGDRPLRILEVGFGSGLNAWLTLLCTREAGIAAEYQAVELYPVDCATAASLGYTDDPLFMEMHTAPWNTRTQISPSFGFMKIGEDLAAMEFSADTSAYTAHGIMSGSERRGCYDLVYFDAFAPDVQPELWTEEIFAKLYGAMAPGGILVTYSAKGSVKQALRKAGFTVERLPGALGKRHMVRAGKQLTIEHKN